TGNALRGNASQQEKPTPVRFSLVHRNLQLSMKTIATALRILELFADGLGQRSVSEIAEHCELPRSQVSRILSTFGRAGWLDQDPKSRRYSVGLPAYVVGSRFVQSHPLTKHAIPLLRDIVDKSGFNTTLSILDHLKPLYLLGIAGPVPVDLSSAFGSYFPFHATAAGKVLAAFAPWMCVSGCWRKQRSTGSRAGPLPIGSNFEMNSRRSSDAATLLQRANGYRVWVLWLFP
ncbi:MAG: hypothetical protein PPHEMADM_5750, partial [uncultured Paraburkholderia sp.]